MAYIVVVAVVMVVAAAAASAAAVTYLAVEPENAVCDGDAAREALRFKEAGDPQEAEEGGG